MLEQAICFIRDVGFPIFVAVYMLVTTRSTLRELKKSVSELTVVVQKLCDKISHDA